MKDRNGKTLRVGDVCVVHRTNDKNTIPISWGDVVVVKYFYNTNTNVHEYPVNCEEGFSQYVFGTDFNPHELEIIGDVR